MLGLVFNGQHFVNQRSQDQSQRSPCAHPQYEPRRQCWIAFQGVTGALITLNCSSLIPCWIFNLIFFYFLLQKQLTYFQKSSLAWSPSQTLVCQNFKRLGPCAINVTTGRSGRPEEFRNAYLKNMSIYLLERCPEPIKAFPWKKACEKFLQRLFSLTLEVAKWLFIPVLIISSLSEMSYCGWQNKELLIPFGMLAGAIFAGVLKETAIELSESLQEGGCPWHLAIIGALFVLIKLPGPYYPYWGRVFLPHFANGGLWRTLWFVNIWYKKPSKATDVESNPGRDSK